MPLADINMLPDHTLERVFFYLNPFDLGRVSQVCTRWSKLSGARRLWSGHQFRHKLRATADCLRSIRLLSRSRGVFPYHKVEVALDSALGRHQISIGRDADRVTVATASPLTMLLSLRHLVCDRVTTLKVTVSQMEALTPFEAQVVWETIASKERLSELFLTLHRGGAMFLCPFEWPQRGFVTQVTFKALGNAPSGSSVCAPVRSLLEMHRYQLKLLYVVNEDQQPLLEFCPSDAFHLQAILLPSLVGRLTQFHRLRSLCLNSHFAHPDVLAEVLSLPGIRHSLWDLDVIIKPGHWEDGEGLSVQALLELLRGFEHLRKVRLIGLSVSPDAPQRGPWNLRGLMKSLPQVKAIVLDVDPCMLPLDVLVPHEGGESVVPDTLTALKLERSTVSVQALHKHSAEDSWLVELRQVMRTAPRLHVIIEASSCFVADRRLSKVVIMPHRVAEACKDCPGFPAPQRGFSTIYIEDYFL
ncbi:uncharacterized protein LOC117645785 isoform X2 [Thrips palmi]|uniref:Uncharacterized protein LOC117645785 isoform X2 n=1 Tax=Thrips palmi TaxID=161013 RepID=A0A6P8YWZ5_THRPL|nr:uncharacterized protein LOC117645785 isoform X2 [Thrips palmi]XP_034242096.1 uncharacterized protein LOC117645785 isoform X2 [Thrips palmi]XP_034242097.1 uncharacterized protein LOC117645785 isoform X2 [Thrips palmi]XP_034242098.1 uncharacterized protein LOC117645785 isoform X2 [Thrips palmi]XP_034242099.1 uncharacterized protein LOC117645785 isoform X2 [Thrips palmi]XP_034242101.1 uncharacterized protein LOC117645785 isoform X2 [Thrips palmi]